ncbi:hypothetical protein [Actinocorallia longicatena]|uniref:Peptidase MA superfamily protein n=1 Tax=Actinocorallia longicatena TaxID=111803 RepID=A0ABP6QGR5_9ACTN
MAANPPGHSAFSRRRLLAAAAVLAVAACAAERPRPAAAPAADPAALDALLARRSRAVLGRDKAAFLATIAPDSVGFLAREEERFDALSAIPFASWRESVTASSGDLVTLSLTYRLRGFDTADAVHTAYLRHRGGLITGDGGERHDDPEIWTSGRVRSVTGRHSLVLGEGPLGEIAAQLDRSVPLVSAVVGGGWARRAVALVPADAERASVLAGGQDLSEIVALAAAPANTGGTPGPSRLLISPEVWRRVNALGRRVVLTHELTHVALNAAADTTTPMWLVEGFADYVGYRGTGTPVREAAKELAASVAKGYRPSALPAREAFASGFPRLSQSYQEAWLACRLIAAEHGEAALLRLYREAGRVPEGDAVKKVLGITDLTARWRAYVLSQLS